jgi:hypothetical protein
MLSVVFHGFSARADNRHIQHRFSEMNIIPIIGRRDRGPGEGARRVPTMMIDGEGLDH